LNVKSVRANLERIALGFALFLIAACGSRDEAGSPAIQGAPGTITAAVTEVRSAQFPVVVEVTGQVAAASQATLSAKVQGTVQELRVREGETVRKGQTLVVLDSRDLRANLARAEAEYDNARTHLARMRRLYQEESVAKQELDNATRAYKVAEAGRRAAEAHLSYTVIKAPFDGVVTEKHIEVGELAVPGRPVLKLEDPRRLRLEATVSEGDVRAVAVGDKITVVVDALGDQPLTGTVAQVLPAGDPATHTFVVKVDLPPTPGLKSGMFGRMRLDRGVSQTLAVPEAAVIERGQLTGVYVVGDDQVAHLRWVKVGRRAPARAQGGSPAPGALGAGNGADVEVLSGLNAGERILADAKPGVDGARVEPTESVALPSTP
jgi:RND family efflux transporter MFP subunit